jgi:hypothetical protein
MCGLSIIECRHHQEEGSTATYRPTVYDYFVMSFGLMNVQTHFMYPMHIVFMQELDKFAVVFIDGILVYSKSMEEQEEHLHVMLQ